MNHYHRISLKEREEISRMLATNQSLRSIGRLLERSPSSISRELRRNARSPIVYRAVTAQRYAVKRARKPRRKRLLELHPKLRQQVFRYLAQLWSPEQIAKELSLRYPNHPRMNISHESIYTYLYALPRGQLKRELITYLRQHHQIRRPRSRRRLKSNPIQDIISIEERPSEVADRIIPGHWEGDLIMGHSNSSALGTLVERVTRFTLLVPLKAKDAISARKAFSRELRTLPQQLKRSLTYDQGQEMTQHRLFTAKTKIKVYFAHPHCPWERGTNENTNGLLRQFFPKGTDFSKITRRKIKYVQKIFNGRPRKVLNWRKPAEVFHGLLH